MPLPSSNISSTLKTKGPLRAPSNDLPAVNLTETICLQIPEKKSPSIEAVVPSVEVKTEQPIDEVKVRLT